MSNSATASKPGGAGLLLSVVYVTALFFIWAFVTNLVDPLIKSTKLIYNLDLFSAMLCQFAFFSAYFVMSLPSAWVLSKFGYANSIIIGLLGIVAGCGIAWSTSVTHTYVTLLIGLFVACSGITMLQVAANPLIATMGDPKGSAFRLNMSQAFNSLGAFVGGMFGASFLFNAPLFKLDPDQVTAHPELVTSAMKAEGLHLVTNVYLEIGAALAVFVIAVFLVRNVIAANSPAISTAAVSPLAALKSKWANLGSIAIFLYVGAEVAVLSGMIFFLEQRQIMHLPTQLAGLLSPFFMACAMLGRFGGGWLMNFVKATRMLSIFAICAAILCAIIICTAHMEPAALGNTVTVNGIAVVLTTGFIPGFAAILIGFFNSIMFPTIFTLTLERSSAPASSTSGLMCMAIFGGGVVPPIYGFVADATGSKSIAFVVPLVCYLYVLWFAMAAKKAPVHAIEEGVSAGH